MTTKEILPLPESTYQLLLDAAGAWPGAVATQWIPGPADYTRRLDWTYADMAGTVTRIANGLASLGVRRPDAVTLCGPSTSMLYAATLAAQAAAGLANARVIAADEDGRLVLTVTGADPGRVRDAVAGFTLTVLTRPQRSDPQKEPRP